MGQGAPAHPARPGTAQGQSTRGSDGRKDRAWARATPRVACWSQSGEGLGVVVPDPLPMPLSGRTSQGTTVVWFH